MYNCINNNMYKVCREILQVLEYGYINERGWMAGKEIFTRITRFSFTTKMASFILLRKKSCFM